MSISTPARAVATATALATILAMPAGPVSADVARRVHHTSYPCSAQSSKIILQVGKAIVFNGPSADGTQAEVCAAPHGTVFQLLPNGFPSGPATFFTHQQLVGDDFAMSAGENDSGGTSVTVSLVDVQTGRSITPSAIAGPLNPDTSFVVSLLATGDQQMVWSATGTNGETGSPDTPAGAADTIVAKYDGTDTPASGATVLATGADIDPHSVAIAGSTIYWKQGGIVHTALLDGPAQCLGGH